MKTKTIIPVLAVLSVGVLVLACGGMEPEDTVESVQESLEQPWGDLDMGDEAPAFNDPALDSEPMDVANLLIPEEPNLDQHSGVLPPKPGAKKKPPLCPHGFLKGKWKPAAPGKPFGKFKGKWVTANGKVHGHLKGFYGKNKLGHGVFFGKYIGAKGKFRGVLKGHYGKGFFRGRWFSKAGLRGRLHGVYAKGVFKGRWVEFCKLCKVTCKPGLKPAVTGWGKCLCIPANVIPCKLGKCPKGMHCNFCPRPPKCKPGMKCPAMCAPPVCKKNPLPPSGKKAPGKSSSEAPQSSNTIN